MDSLDQERDRILKRLYEALLTSQNLAEMAGLSTLARDVAEVRRKVHVTLSITSDASHPAEPDQN